MFEISKDFTFQASHQLKGLPEGHQCSRLHGHSYTVRVMLSGDVLDPAGMLVDYGDLRPFGAWLDANLDHRHLNDVAAFTGCNPTAEHMARVLHGVLRDTVSIGPHVQAVIAVSETVKTWATYRP